MIRIDWKTLDSVAQEYVERLIEWAKVHSHSCLQTKILKNMSVEDFKSLILCPPHRLSSLTTPTNMAGQWFITTYKKFFKDSGQDGENNASWLTQKLNINVCPYCNRTYIFTLKGKKPKSRCVRPELDHFYPKAKYNFLALSFYNVIPSCPSCNHLKSTKEFDFHPYAGSLNASSEPVFKVKNYSRFIDGEFILFPEKPEISIESPNTNTKELCLEQLYELHSDYVKEILDKIQAYNASLYMPLIDSFRSVGRTPEEINRLIWGNYIEKEGYTKRPLSKLTHDILEQFGII